MERNRKKASEYRAKMFTNNVLWYNIKFDIWGETCERKRCAKNDLRKLFKAVFLTDGQDFLDTQYINIRVPVLLECMYVALYIK